MAWKLNNLANSLINKYTHKEPETRAKLANASLDTQSVDVEQNECPECFLQTNALMPGEEHRDHVFNAPVCLPAHEHVNLGTGACVVLIGCYFHEFPRIKKQNVSRRRNYALVLIL